MAKFYFRCRNRIGELVTGFYETDTPDAVAAALRGKGYFPVYIRRIHQYKNIFNMILSVFNRPTTKELSLFSRQLKSLVGAGLTVTDSLKILMQQTHGKLRPVLCKVVKDTSNGFTLSQALGNYPVVFPELFVNMVKAGEISGKIENTMERLANHYEKDYILKEKIKTSVTYPFFLSVVSFIVVLFLVTCVLPVFENMFSEAGAQLPLLTRVLIKFGLLVKFKYPYIILAFIITLLVIKIIVSNPRGQALFSEKIFKVPVYGSIYKKSIVSRFARVLSLLIYSGGTTG